jgi:hypothetical protein
MFITQQWLCINKALAFNPLLRFGADHASLAIAASFPISKGSGEDANANNHAVHYAQAQKACEHFDAEGLLTQVTQTFGAPVAGNLMANACAFCSCGGGATGSGRRGRSRRRWR